MIGEQKLWQAVISRAVLDAGWSGKERDYDGSLNIEATEKGRADAWLSSGSKDFRAVCDLAGIDPDFLRDSYRSGRLDLEVFSASEKKRRSIEKRREAERVG